MLPITKEEGRGREARSQQRNRLPPVGSNVCAKRKELHMARTCSKKTLKGTYLFAYEGFEIRNGDKVPFAVAGIEERDGKGKVEGVYSANGSSTHCEPFSGTYDVNKDCTGTNKFPDDDSQYDMFIDPDGSEFTVVMTNSDFVASWTTKRVASRRVED
jgi:hypothetical protein